MKPRSAKNKGVRLQNWCRDRVLEAFPALSKADVKCAVMGESGMDLHLSTIAQEVFPWAVEAKNTERVQLWRYWDQCVENAEDGLRPLLIIKSNNRAPVAVVDAEWFINQQKEDK